MDFINIWNSPKILFSTFFSLSILSALHLLDPNVTCCTCLLHWYFERFFDFFFQTSNYFSKKHWLYDIFGLSFFFTVKYFAPNVLFTFSILIKLAVHVYNGNTSNSFFNFSSKIENIFRKKFDSIFFDYGFLYDVIFCP